MTNQAQQPLSSHVGFMMGLPKDVMQQLELLGAATKIPAVKMIEQIVLDYVSPPVGTPMVAMPDGTKDFVRASIPREKYETIRDAASMHGIPKGDALYNAVLAYIATTTTPAPASAVAPDAPDALAVTDTPNPSNATIATLKKRASPKFQL